MIFGCVNDRNFESNINNYQNNITDFSYAGIYLSVDEGSTYHGKIIINAYSNKSGEIYLSMCIIEVVDSALRPNYHIINNVFVNRHNELIKGGKKIGKFNINNSEINNKNLVINDVAYFGLP